jgi:hypothetical protein
MEGGGAQTVQEPGLAKDKRAGTNGKEIAGAGTPALYPRDQPGILRRRIRTAAKKGQDIERRRIIDGIVRYDLENALRDDRALLTPCCR